MSQTKFLGLLKEIKRISKTFFTLLLTFGSGRMDNFTGKRSDIQCLK